jgi:hypothetical protein
MEQLPLEMNLQVLLRLPIRDLLRSRAVNKTTNELSRDDYFWRLRLEQDYPEVSIPENIGEPGHHSYYDLYMYMYHHPKGRARLIQIPSNLLPEDDLFLDYYDNMADGDDVIDVLNHSPDIRAFLQDAKIRRGDVIHLEPSGDYRNDGKFMYDGHNIVPLDYSLDDYGAVPASFQVIREFPIHYWQGIIVHNAIVHFDIRPYLDQVMANLRCDQVMETGVICRSKFTYWTGMTYDVIIPLDEPQSDAAIRKFLAKGIFGYDDETELTSDIPDFHYDEARTLFLSPFATFERHQE